ncbi:hypothetical protein SCOR_33175 [Sulfidibacter corallicola]|uniref:Ferritin-like domain-containing protein n=1 Tax=Sulfidibacter corallicola TaxID=2818388 RepID=A0A8A4TJ82_SULCO|nr:hypothetical protein [Sulfidibacter corallicola]QTD49610.1 hypothetical protein J3U87_28825 [Sulfidibacter corallicola]
MNLPHSMLELLEQQEIGLHPIYAARVTGLQERNFVTNSKVMRAMNEAMFADNRALAFRLKRHSEHETLGARFIEAIATEHADGQLQEDLLAHAADEYRHGRMFKTIYKEVAATTMTDDFDDHRETVENELAAFDGALVSFLFASHTAEIRNYYLLHQYLELITGVDKPYRHRLEAVLHQVMGDEIRHVVYTARYVNELLAEDPSRAILLDGYLAEYSRMSWQEMALIASYFATREPEPVAVSAL